MKDQFTVLEIDEITYQPSPSKFTIIIQFVMQSLQIYDKNIMRIRTNPLPDCMTDKNRGRQLVDRSGIFAMR